MSYFIFNEGWKKYAHVGLKNGLAAGAVAGTIVGGPIGGAIGYTVANTNNRVGNAYNSFMDTKFFNSHFKIDTKLNDMIYSWCSKLDKPISRSDAEYDTQYKNLSRFLPHKFASTEFHIIKKIWGPNEKLYFVAFTFDDEKILEIKLVKMLNPDNAKLIKLPQWKTINPEEYKKK